MTLRNPKRLVPRDVAQTSITKACPADAAATLNISGLEQDTCECGSVPANKAFSRHAPASLRIPRLAGHGIFEEDSSSQAQCDRANSPRRFFSSYAAGAFFVGAGKHYWLDVKARWSVEGARDFRNLELKGRC